MHKIVSFGSNWTNIFQALIKTSLEKTFRMKVGLFLVIKLVVIGNFVTMTNLIVGGRALDISR